MRDNACVRYGRGHLCHLTTSNKSRLALKVFHLQEPDAFLQTHFVGYLNNLMSDLEI
jgi:hypothetical protein